MRSTPEPPPPADSPDPDVDIDPAEGVAVVAVRERRGPWSMFVAWSMAAFVITIASYDWLLYRRYSQFGFDTGIFTQGTWLLSHFHEPFVTIRGLSLFGDHASFILVLVAPIYFLFPAAPTLTTLQTIGMAMPAIALYRIGSRWTSRPAAAAIAIAYLLYPSTMWSAEWQFHPESFAAAFLSFAVLALDSHHNKRMYLFLGLALICKEDVSVVVVGIGVLLLTQRRYRHGFAVIGIAVSYFLIVTMVVMRAINGAGNLYFKRNYGVDGTGPGAVILALPHILWKAIETGFNGDAAGYLGIIFGSFALLSLLGGRWFIPALGPLVLNLASAYDYQRNVTFQYMATSSFFFALAALAALRFLTRKKTARELLAVGVLCTAMVMTWKFGPLKDIKNGIRDHPTDLADRRDAIAAIPKDAPVSAQYNFDTTLANRKEIYEFPVPFVPRNWGLADSTMDRRLADNVQYIIVEPSTLNDEDLTIYNRLISSGDWETIAAYGEVIVLHRTDGSTPGAAPGVVLAQ